MDWKDITYVMTVAKYGSITKAAEKLYLAQPTLSERISNLESDLGVQLFIRSRKGMTPTLIGREFLAESEELMGHVDSFERRIRGFCTLLQGTVRIGLYWAFGYTKILEQLHRFLSEFYSVRATYQIDGSVDLLKRVQQKELDLAFVTGYEESDFSAKIRSICIGESRFVALVHKNHALSKYSTIHFRDLKHQSILNISPKSRMYPAFMALLKEYASSVQIIGESSQMDAAYQIAEKGIGISFLSEEVAKTLVKDEVRAIPLVPPIYRRVYLIYGEEGDTNPIVHQLVQVFRQQPLKNEI